MASKMILQLLQQSGNFVVLLIQYRINKLDLNCARHLPVRIHLSKVAGKSLDVTLACAEKNGKEVIVVDSIYEAGMTERMGLLNVGDQVLEINGKRLISLQAANEILDSTFQDFWVEMVMIPKHRETRFPARMGKSFDTSNEIKYSLSADNYPDVARINTNKHNWTNQTTSCYPNFPVTKFNLKSIKNVFNSCDPLKHSFCSASQGNLASKKNGDFRNTCHDLSCFQPRQQDSHFKYERPQPIKDNYLQNNCVQNGPNIADSPNVGGFATSKPSTRIPDLMYSVLLTKPRESIDLGIFISEGNEKRNVVQAVQEFSLADQTKAIHVGDEILRVNGLNLCGLPSEKAQMMILREFSTSDELCLVIRKTFHQTNVKKRCEMLAQERFDSTVVPQRNQPIEEILSNHCFIPRQNFHIGNPHFDVRAVVHHSLDDLGKHQNLNMSSISDPAPFFSPQSQGRIKLTIKPLPDAIHNRPDETSLISKTCSDINDTTLSLQTQAEEVVETNNTTFQNFSSHLNSEKNVKNPLQDNKLEILLSTLHHIDSDPPSPVARLSSLFDFLDSEDDLDRPFGDKSQDVNKENSVINSAPESVKPQAGSQNSIKSLGVKRKAECSKTANRCICSLTYLTCSTSATTTTKHTSGSPRENSSTQNCSYRTGDIAGPAKKDIRVSTTFQSKFKKYGSVTQAEMFYDQWSKLFESVQFPSVESFSDNMEYDQNTASCTNATVNFLSNLKQPIPRPISVESTADYQVSSREKQTIEGSTPTDPELRAVPRLLDDMPMILPALNVIEITLTRELPTDSFGFGLSDGIQEPGIFVSGIMPGGPAENALQLYDKVIQANGADTSTMTTSSIISTIKEAGRTLELVICRQERNRNPND